MDLITPKYLTRQIADKAVTGVVKAIIGQGAPLRSKLKREHFHIVVLVPGKGEDREKGFYEHPNYLLAPVCLYELSVGEKSEWEHDYSYIARSKAHQLWTDRNSDRPMVTPHLLFSGDTPYWGGVKRRGIVVACSGVQPWFDQMISGIVADVLVALAHDAYENDEERKKGVDFLS